MTAPSPVAARTVAPTLGRLLQIIIGAASVGAGVVHVSAASDHWSQGMEAGLFITAAVAQVAWGIVIIRRFSRPLLLVGAAGQLLLAMCWVLTRTRGLELFGGETEPLGWKDGIAGLLELGAAAGALLVAALPEQGRSLHLPTGRLAQHAALSSVVGLTLIAAVFAPGHSGAHGGEAAHAHGGAGLSGDAHTELAAGQMDSHSAAGSHDGADSSMGHGEDNGEVAHGHEAGAPQLLSGVTVAAGSADTDGHGAHGLGSPSGPGLSSAALSPGSTGHGQHGDQGPGSPSSAGSQPHDTPATPGSAPHSGTPGSSEPNGRAHEHAGQSQPPAASSEHRHSPPTEESAQPGSGQPAPEGHQHEPGSAEQGQAGAEPSPEPEHDHGEEEDRAVDVPGLPEGLLPIRLLMAALRPSPAP